MADGKKNMGPLFPKHVNALCPMPSTQAERRQPLHPPARPANRHVTLHHEPPSPASPWVTYAVDDSLVEPFAFHRLPSIPTADLCTSNTPPVSISIFPLTLPARGPAIKQARPSALAASRPHLAFAIQLPPPLTHAQPPAIRRHEDHIQGASASHPLSLRTTDADSHIGPQAEQVRHRS
jgi:hypothetical protein